MSYLDDWNRGCSELAGDPASPGYQACHPPGIAAPSSAAGIGTPARLRMMSGAWIAAVSCLAYGLASLRLTWPLLTLRVALAAAVGAALGMAFHLAFAGRGLMPRLLLCALVAAIALVAFSHADLVEAIHDALTGLAARLR